VRYSDTSGINEQVKKVFWTLFVAMAGLVLARVVDPVNDKEVICMNTGTSGELVKRGYLTPFFSPVVFFRLCP